MLTVELKALKIGLRLKKGQAGMPPPLSGSPPATSGSAFPTAAEAVKLIKTWTDLKPSRRQDLHASVIILEHVFEQPLEKIWMDPDELERRYVVAAAVACGIAASSFVTYRASLRAVLRRLGLMDQPLRDPTLLHPSWMALRAALPDRLLSVRLQAFMAFCNECSRLPEAVTDDDSEAFYNFLTERRLLKSPSQETRLVAEAWNRAVDRVPGWPKTILTIPNRSRYYSPAFTAYPEKCQADIEAFRQRITPATRSSSSVLDQYSGRGFKGRGRPIKQGGIDTRMRSLRMVLAALVLSGTDIASVTSLAVLLEPANLLAIVDWHWNRAGQRVTDHTGVISDTLRVVAKYHVGLTGRKLEAVLSVLRLIKPPKRKEMTDKNEKRLDQFDDPVNENNLLLLPKHLLQNAQLLLASGQTRQAAWQAGIAIAIEIELHYPMRISNLASLRLDKHLLKLDSNRSRWTHFFITGDGDREAGDGTKNGILLNSPISAETAAMIDLYIQQYRPYINTAQSDWLFPSRDYPDRPRFPPGLSKTISDTIYQVLGLEMTTHFFRVFAGSLLLRDNPGAIEDLRNLLGHSTMHTSLIYYKSHLKKRAPKLISEAIFIRRQNSSMSIPPPVFDQGESYNWNKLRGPGRWS